MRSGSTTSKNRRRPAPSGRFVLRLEPDLHARLRGAARTAGISLNAYCEARLALADSIAHLEGDSEPIIRRAMEVFGKNLVGVVAYGSWARGEAADGSDIDILIVLDSSARLSR